MQKKELQILLGKQIKIVREAKNMSRIDLAAAVEKDIQSIQRLESGNINPSFYYLHEIARGLNVTVSELLQFDEQI